jgi:hypothetical protein
MQVPGLIRDLRSFQQRDLARLIHLPHGANFSVPGAGQDDGDLRHPRHRTGRCSSQQAPDCSPIVRFRRMGGVLVNYQRLPGTLPALTSWMLTSKVHLVVDEAHQAKRGALGEWGRRLLVLAPLAVRRDLLTGTPAPNHPRDLAALLEILWPGGGAPALPRAALRPDPPHAAMADVNRTIRPLYVRTTKDELKLPPIRITHDPVPLTDLQQQIYDALLSRYSGCSTSADEMLRCSPKWVRLRCICCRPHRVPVSSPVRLVLQGRIGIRRCVLHVAPTHQYERQHDRRRWVTC